MFFFRVAVRVAVSARAARRRRIQSRARFFCLPRRARQLVHPEDAGIVTVRGSVGQRRFFASVFEAVAIRRAHAQRDARVRPFPRLGRVRRFLARVRGRRDTRDEVGHARDRAPERGGQAGRQADAHDALDDVSRAYDDSLSHGAHRALSDAPLAGVQARVRLRSAHIRRLLGLDPRGVEPLDAVPRDVDGAHAHGPIFGARAHADRKGLPGGHGVDIQEGALQDEGGNARVNRGHRARRGSPSRPRGPHRASRVSLRAPNTGRASNTATRRSSTGGNNDFYGFEGTTKPSALVARADARGSPRSLRDRVRAAWRRAARWIRSGICASVFRGRAGHRTGRMGPALTLRRPRPSHPPRSRVRMAGTRPPRPPRPWLPS